MNRLTHERRNGIKSGYWSPNKKQELVDRLAEYENTGLTPEEIKSLSKSEGGSVKIEERSGKNWKEAFMRTFLAH